jgi:hypothetical protein
MTATTNSSADLNMFAPDLGAPVEKNIAIDIVKRSVYFVPILLIIGAIAGGTKGAASTLFAIVIVLANFLLSAFALSWAARVSFVALGMAAMFGFLIRLGLITAAVLLVRKQDWVSIPILGIMIVVTHLALLLWELRFVSLSFSSPGVRERPDERSSTRSSVNSVNPVPVKE